MVTKKKEEALLLRGPHNKERWNTRSSVASHLIVTTCLSFQAYKTRPKEFGALEFSAGNGKMSFYIGMVSARGACPCLLIQTKQQPLVLRDKPMEFLPTWGNVRAISVLIPGSSNEDVPGELNQAFCG